MIPNLVPCDEFTGQLRDQVAAVTDYTDLAAVVSLVEGDFDVKDASTWPTISTAFTALTATDAWELQYDATSGKNLLVAPDPDGGWDFTSVASGVTITGFKVTSMTALNPVFAAKFLNPIPVTATGQHITIPYVAADVSTVMLDGQNPYDMA